MLRRVHRERALALAGPRALLMQAAHPLAVSGLLAHSNAIDEPYDRLARTAEVMSTIGFGSREDADRVTTHVRAMHRRVKGTIKRAGRRLPGRHALPRRRSRAAAVGAVHARRLGDRRLPQVRRPHDARAGGRLLGGLQAGRASCSACARPTCRPRWPTSTTTAARCSRATCSRSPTGRASAPARSCSSRRCRWFARPLLETANFITIALLPDRIRREYGFSPLPPASVRKALVAGGAEYVKRALIPFLPERLRLVPAARNARAAAA